MHAKIAHSIHFTFFLTQLILLVKTLENVVNGEIVLELPYVLLEVPTILPSQKSTGTPFHRLMETDQGLNICPARLEDKSGDGNTTEAGIKFVHS